MTEKKRKKRIETGVKSALSASHTSSCSRGRCSSNLHPEPREDVLLKLELEEARFHPQISENSHRIVQEKRRRNFMPFRRMDTPETLSRMVSVEALHKTENSSNDQKLEFQKISSTKYKTKRDQNFTPTKFSDRSHKGERSRDVSSKKKERPPSTRNSLKKQQLLLLEQVRSLIQQVNLELEHIAEGDNNANDRRDDSSVSRTPPTSDRRSLSNPRALSMTNRLYPVGQPAITSLHPTSANGRAEGSNGRPSSAINRPSSASNRRWNNRQPDKSIYEVQPSLVYREQSANGRGRDLMQSQEKGRQREENKRDSNSREREKEGNTDTSQSVRSPYAVSLSQSYLTDTVAPVSATANVRPTDTTAHTAFLPPKEVLAASDLASNTVDRNSLPSDTVGRSGRPSSANSRHSRPGHDENTHGFHANEVVQLRENSSTRERYVRPKQFERYRSPSPVFVQEDGFAVQKHNFDGLYDLSKYAPKRERGDGREERAKRERYVIIAPPPSPAKHFKLPIDQSSTARVDYRDTYFSNWRAVFSQQKLLRAEASVRNNASPISQTRRFSPIAYPTPSIVRFETTTASPLHEQRPVGENVNLISEKQNKKNDQTKEKLSLKGSPRRLEEVPLSHEISVGPTSADEKKNRIQDIRKMTEKIKVFTKQLREGGYKDSPTVN